MIRAPTAMVRPRRLALLRLLARLVLGGVLIASGLLKLTDLAASVAAVNRFAFLPWMGAVVVGFALPFVEALVGALLLADVASRAAAGVAVVLMVAFVIGIASLWARGIAIDCGCFGGGRYVDVLDTKNYALDIARDLGLAVLGGFILASAPDRWRALAGNR